MATTEKKILSNILREKREWHRVDKELPEDPRQLVLIRFMSTNPKFILKETDTEIYPIEDMKIAFYDGNDWTICGPHPLYDFSPLSDEGEFRDQVVVTHWSEATTDELIGWACRYSPFNSFTELTLTVDEDHKELIYRALLNAAGVMSAMSMSKEIPDKERQLYAMYHQAICDLETCMDIGGHITEDTMKNGDEITKFFKTEEDLVDYILRNSIQDKNVNTTDESE